jgi:hypothetical protein
MIRRLFTLLSGLSLVLCVATCALWVRSYQTADVFRLKSTPYSAHVVSVGGTLVVEVAWPEYRSDSAPPLGPRHQILARERAEHLLEWDAKGTVARYHLAGLEYRDESGIVFSHDNRYTVLVPLWLVLFAASLLPLAWARQRHRVRSQISTGLCPACGYDLRASPGRCPECGADPSDPAPTGRKLHSPG